MKCYHKMIQVGGKQKVVQQGDCFEGWLGRKLGDEVIQLGGSSWAINMVALRTKISGMWLFYDLLICASCIRLLGYYVLNWAVWLSWSLRYEIC